MRINIRLFFIISILLLVFSPMMTVYTKRADFFTFNYWDKYESYKKSYENSQYVKKLNPIIIPDETFESYAGGAFLRGLNPILITHDHPPLGRYIISLSILLFQNQHIIIIPLFGLSVFGIFLIARTIFKDNLYALFPVVLILNEPLFEDKLVYTPLPEIIQYPFIIYSIFFFIKGVSSKNSIRPFILTSILLGGVIATRVFVLGGIMVASMLMYLTLYDRKKILSFILVLPFSICILMLSYTKTIIDGYSIVEVFGIQKYILAYHKSKFILPFSFWDLLFFNRWHTWWDGNKIIHDANWVITWPVGAVCSMLYGVFWGLRKIKVTPSEKIIFIWLVCYMLFLSVGYTSTRYFMPIVPFLYILSFAFLFKLLGLLKKD